MIIDGHFCHDEAIQEMTHYIGSMDHDKNTYIHVHCISLSTVLSFCVLTICNFSYIPFWGLRAEFGLLFLQFLAIAYLLQ